MEHEHFTGKVISQKIIQADNPTMILIKLMLDNDTKLQYQMHKKIKKPL